MWLWSFQFIIIKHKVWLLVSLYKERVLSRKTTAAPPCTMPLAFLFCSICFLNPQSLWGPHRDITACHKWYLLTDLPPLFFLTGTVTYYLRSDFNILCVCGLPVCNVNYNSQMLPTAAFSFGWLSADHFTENCLSVVELGRHVVQNRQQNLTVLSVFGLQPGAEGQRGKTHPSTSRQYHS